jgi:hypothetical protein
MSEVVEILQDGDLVFARVKSKRYSNIWHNVFYNKIDKVGSCDCEGFFNNRKCWHFTAVLQRLGLELPV